MRAITSIILFFALALSPISIAAQQGGTTRYVYDDNGRLRAVVSQRAFRVAAGSLVLAFGAWGLARASGLPETLRQTILCL